MEETPITENGQSPKDVPAKGSKLLDWFLSTLKNAFSFKGRAARAEFWSFVIACAIINLILGLLCIPEDVFPLIAPIAILVDLYLVIALISVSVRRLHDLDLTGFWLWYLSPTGLPIVFMVNLLNLDESCNSVLDRISKVCTNWFAWILLPIFWFIGAPAATLLLFLYAGKNIPNQFGPSPYAE